MTDTKTGIRPTFLVDTREQNPYELPDYVDEALETGDYTIMGYEDKIVIERKELSDFLNCVGNDRERFTRELERMTGFELPIVLIEADFTEALKPSRHNSELHPNSILGSVCAWIAKFQIHFLFCGGRELGQRTTKKILEKFEKYENEK